MGAVGHSRHDGRCSKTSRETGCMALPRSFLQPALAGEQSMNGTAARNEGSGVQISRALQARIWALSLSAESSLDMFVVGRGDMNKGHKFGGS